MATLGRRPHRLHELLSAAGFLLLLGIGLQALTGGFVSAPPAGRLVYTLTSPLLGVGEGIHRRMETAWMAMFAADQREAEIASLQEALAAARVQVATERSRVALDTVALDVSTHMPSGAMDLTPAPVLSAPVAGGRQVLWIGRGHDKDLRPGMVVMGPGGIIGQIAEVYDRRSLVLLISDERATWSGEVEWRGELGVLRGTGREHEAEFHFNRTTTTTEVGDWVVSTGMVDSLAPGGVPFGRVREVRLNKNGEPIAMVDLDPMPARLRTVFVLPVVKVAAGSNQ